MFTKSSFGLDICDDSVRFVELLPVKGGIEMGRYGERKIPVGVVELGKVKDPKKLEKILTALKGDVGLKSAHIALSHGDGETIKEHLSVFKNSAISVKSFESEVDALCRSILPEGDKETYMVVDFGKSHSNIFVISNGNVFFGSKLDFGGDAVTEIIREKLGVSLEEAEKLKKEYGLTRATADKPKQKEIFSLISNALSILRDEAAQHFLYWHTRVNKESHTHAPIKKIILSGSESNLNGLSEYLAVSMRNKVEVANVWVNILDTEKNIPEMSFEQSFAFASALGLALRDFIVDPAV